jgi:hypothetical protein
MSNVNHPKHYSLDIHCECGKNIECLDIVKNLPFVDGNIIKYVWRWRDKNGLEDLFKAQFYLNNLIESQQIKQSKMKAITVDDLELTVRTTNALKSEGIDTIEKILLCHKKNNLYKIPNFGKKGFDELILKLNSIGYSLNDK